MKKLSALILALVMLASFAMAEPQVVTFTDMVSEDQLALGTYDTLNDELPVKVWIPDGYFAVVNPSDDPDAYILDMTIGVFKYLPDESQQLFFNMMASDTGTFDDLINGLKAEPENFLKVEEAIVNGFRCVSYQCPEGTDEFVAYATYEITPAVYLNIMFKTNDANVEFNQIASVIAASVAPAD